MRHKENDLDQMKIPARYDGKTACLYCVCERDFMRNSPQKFDIIETISRSWVCVCVHVNVLQNSQQNTLVSHFFSHDTENWINNSETEKFISFLEFCFRFSNNFFFVLPLLVLLLLFCFNFSFLFGCHIFHSFELLHFDARTPPFIVRLTFVKYGETKLVQVWFHIEGPRVNCPIWST